MQEIIQLKVSLTHSKPLIWRQIQIHTDTSFFELHHIIQIVMGWDNYHMFEFDLEGFRIGEVDEEEKSNGYGSDQLMDSREVTLKDVIIQPKDIITYLYDFGDGWQHQVKVEKLLAFDTTTKYPICIDGQMNAHQKIVEGSPLFITALTYLTTKSIRTIKKLPNGSAEDIILHCLTKKK